MADEEISSSKEENKGNTSDKASQNRLLEEIFLRLSRAMLQHEQLSEFDSNPKLFLTAISGFFETWAERVEQQSMYRATPTEILQVIAYSMNSIESACATTSSLRDATSTKEFIRLSPLVPLDRVRREVIPSNGSVQTAPNFMGAGLMDIIEVCRVLDEKCELRTPPGVVNITHFLSVCGSLLPFEKLSELILFLAEAVFNDCEKRFQETVLPYSVLAAVLAEWASVDAYHRRELRLLSDLLQQQRNQAGVSLPPLDQFIRDALGKEEFRSLTVTSTDPKCTAEPPPRHTSLSLDTPVEESKGEVDGGDLEKEEEYDSESTVSVSDDIDYKFWSQLAS